MKVYIGKYVEWIGPYQIADWLRWVGVNEKTRRDIGDALAGTKLSSICEWIHSKRNRKVKIKFHNYDTWSFDSTLALIILPGLKQLRDTKHGYGLIDIKDVPEDVLKTFPIPKDEDLGYCPHRYEWFMNEVIWTFEQLQPDCDWEDLYYDFNAKPIITKENRIRRDEQQARISRGLILFGKYFQTLWD